MKTYKIVRFDVNEDQKVIKTGLTLEQAQEHCQRADSHETAPDSDVLCFDGYTEE